MATTTAPFLSQVSLDFLWRVAANDRSMHQATALGELERREFADLRGNYFSNSAPTTTVNARDLVAGNVITGGSGYVRLVVRDVFRLVASDRILVTISYTNLVTGEVDETKRELPLMRGGEQVRLVRASVPDFSVQAVAR